ncbi:MAG: NAD+ synthase [Alphaproteobacteria bacterium]|nr:NAD+ synthase [Alphaproteobacteria bacterium]
MTSAFSLALAQINPTVGDLAGNAARMQRMAEDAATQGADLVLYPEMCLTGYPPEDLILIPAFRERAMAAARQLAVATRELRCDLMFGSVWVEEGCIYNASLLAARGEITVIRKKHDLPNYGVFDEKRVFQAGPEPRVVVWRGITLGVLICEEVWDVNAATALAAQGAEILLVQNASPYHIGKAGQRKKVVDAAVAATGLPLVYVNLVGGQDELVFDGRSYAVGSEVKDVARLPAFQETLGMTRWEKDGRGWQCVAAPMVEISTDERTIYHALVLGLRDYVGKNNFPGVVLGLSGGIDSGVTAAIAVDALGPQQVHTLRLPSPFTSEDSLEDAQQLAAALAIRMDTVPITPLIDTARQTLAPLFAGRHADTTEENIQARLRGLLLMGVSNKFGAMVLTTGNKSEMSVGYATLYGDMCGGFSVLKDVYKTTVTRLAHWRNAQTAESLAAMGLRGAAGEVIPPRMIAKPPTAELRPNQRDEDSLPPYALLDAILRGLIERQLSVAELVAEGMDEPTVERVARMVAAAEYKRRQSAPGVKITPMAFGRDRRWPITNRWQFA